MNVATAIAREIDRLARANAHNLETVGKAWANDAQETLDYIQADILPSGSGFNSGCQIDLDESTAQRIVIRTSFHHMNETGYYSGWTDHRVTITPCLIWGHVLKISGKDKNGIKEYIGDVFANCLQSEFEPKKGA